MAAFRGFTAAVRTAIVGSCPRNFTQRSFTGTTRFAAADANTEPSQPLKEKTSVTSATDDKTEPQQILNKDRDSRRPESRKFFSDHWLYMNKHYSNVHFERQRLGRQVTWFQQQMSERLDNEDSQLLFKDCVSYLRLLDEPNLERAVQLVDRYDAQMEADVDIGLGGLLNNEIPLHVEAIRKCHELGNPDIALKIFDKMKPTAGYVLALKLVLDLCYKTGRFEDCAKLAVNNSEVEGKLRWLHDIGIISAYSMQSPQGLQLAATLYDSLKGSVTEKVVRDRQLLLALYCIEQGHSNAALSLISSLETDNRLTVIVNLRVKVFLSASQINKAIRLLVVHQKALEKEIADKGEPHGKTPEKFILYRDVFFMLRDTINKLGTPSEKKYLQHLSHRNVYNTLVNHSSLVYVLKGPILRWRTAGMAPNVRNRPPSTDTVHEDAANFMETDFASEVAEEPIYDVSEVVAEEKVESQGTPV